MSFVYNIVIAPSVYFDLLPNKPATYAAKEKPIDAISDALRQKGTKFTTKEENNETVFLNEAGGELARVVQSPGANWR